MLLLAFASSVAVSYRAWYIRCQHISRTAFFRVIVDFLVISLLRIVNNKKKMPSVVVEPYLEEMRQQLLGIALPYASRRYVTTPML